MKLNKIFLLFLMLFLLTSCTKSGAMELGETAADFSLKDLDGNTVNLSDFKGKAVILNFFATWCPPCRGEIPDFIELQKSYAAQGFSIIGISDENSDTVKDFAGKSGINYPVLIDSGGKAYKLYGPIRGIPTTFIIDKEFKIKQKYIGARSRDVFENDIKELVK